MADDTRTRAAAELSVRVGKRVDAATRRLVQAYAAAWQRVRDELVAAATEAEAAAAATGQVANAAAYRTARLSRSLDAISAQLQALSYLPGVAVSRAVGPVVRVPAQVMAELGRLSGVDFAMPPRDALARIVARTTERIASNRPRLSALAESELRSSLTLAMAGGTGPRQAARAMVAASRAAKAAELGLPASTLAELTAMDVAPGIVAEVRGAFAGGMFRALNLTRTELIDASHHGSQALWLANPGLVTGWRWVCDLGPRTCPGCWAMHNSVHKSDESLLGHQSCRCTQVPILAGDEPGDSDVGDPLHAFRAMSRADQLKVMGPGRLELLDRGLPIQRLAGVRDNPGWRPGYYPRALRDLPGPGEHLAAMAAEHEAVAFGAGLEPAAMDSDALLALMADERLYGNDALASQVIAELDRRDALQAAAGARAGEAAVGEAIDAWGAEQAAADAALAERGLDPARYRPTPRASTAASRAAELRADYDLWVHSQWLAASEATRGNLLSREAISRGIDDRALFTGPHSSAWRWASEELQAWWGENPRLTFVEWKAAHGVGGERARKAARRAAETRAKGQQTRGAELRSRRGRE